VRRFSFSEPYSARFHRRAHHTYVMKWGITELQAVDDVVIVSGHNLGTLPLKMLLTSIQQLLSQQL
jgi:hypothetical protein